MRSRIFGSIIGRGVLLLEAEVNTPPGVDETGLGCAKSAVVEVQKQRMNAPNVVHLFLLALITGSRMGKLYGFYQRIHFSGAEHNDKEARSGL
ncbi:MAG: hypothetical protein KGQ60_13165 [Planctomycetes bacterium]|nr:hypothetical protein [Planctomycetota bacterium]